MQPISYNVIGDIHARTCWRNLVREDSINIFVGDYFDPYEIIPPFDQIANFHEILAFKRQHPETVLLYGNHDFHYLDGSEHYSRYNTFAAEYYHDAFVKSQSLFSDIAYPIADKALVTHAGVSNAWYEKYIGVYHSESLAEVAQQINELWNTDKQAFAFEPNASGWRDRYGTSPTHSPIWIRPETLKEHDLFANTDIKQIFGHTQTGYGVTKDHNHICVDCLGTRERTYLLEI